MNKCLACSWLPCVSPLFMSFFVIDRPRDFRAEREIPDGVVDRRKIARIEEGGFVDGPPCLEALLHFY